MLQNTEFTLELGELENRDVSRVGGKNASLGELLQRLSGAGVRVPDGFATTAEAYRAFIDENDLEQLIREATGAQARGETSLTDAGARIREAITGARFSEKLRDAITRGYRELAARVGIDEPAVAVRSSATAEDLPEASFAGQQETFLNIRGEEALLDACRRCYASLFTDRAISYRDNQGIDHLEVELSVGVQQMVRSDLASAGVIFSIDTETGFPGTVLIDGSWGLGESVVQGSVDPDEFVVFKPLLEDRSKRPILLRKLGAKSSKIVYADDTEEPVRTIDTPDAERARFVLDEEEILQLARWAVAIEQHYGRPMDIEWAKDGETGELFVVQARPETVQSRKGATLRSYRIRNKGEQLVTGAAIGEAIAVGKVRKLDSPEQVDRFDKGDILVTPMTDPDWVPVMKKAGAIVTDHGGRTSHAAIVSRELGVPAVVGTGDATAVLQPDREVTVSCAEGDLGFVYDGAAEYEEKEIDPGELPETRTDVMVNMANPGTASRWWRLPAAGVGLARMEFIIGNIIKAHPKALLAYDKLDDELRARIDEITAGWPDKAEFFVDNLAFGIARIAAIFHPAPVIVRLSDFKTNEYAGLVGGRDFEPEEENPMLGWRGASRYYSDDYRDAFALECRAVRKVRETIGLENVKVMVPFCRTTGEAQRVIEEMRKHGLVRGENGLETYVMCELPSNVVLAHRFAEHFDGFSIGSNDLTQLTLGIDRDSERLADLFDERDEAVKSMIGSAIAAARKAGRRIGLCGQAPSDHPEFAEFLVREKIDSISVDPSQFAAVKEHVAKMERN